MLQAQRCTGATDSRQEALATLNGSASAETHRTGRKEHKNTNATTNPQERKLGGKMSQRKKQANLLYQISSENFNFSPCFSRILIVILVLVPL